MNIVHVITAVCFVWFFAESYKHTRASPFRFALWSIMTLILFCGAFLWYVSHDLYPRLADIYYGTLGIFLGFVAYAMHRTAGPMKPMSMQSTKASMVGLILAVVCMGVVRLAFID